jgi:phenylpropionate dioxygenase-like ring-hydroxylating dioxygenase large terminal subunit
MTVEQVQETVPGNSFSAPGTRNFPLNSWWVVARGDELTRTPFGRRIADLPIVLFRRQDGTPVALADRCPHRWLPLSMGKIIGDEIQCLYHGMRFDAEGACTGIPTQDRIPRGMAVQRYPLREVGPLIWIWTGRPEDAAGVEPPATPWFDTGWAWSVSSLHADANYMLLHENVMDLTHFAYLHEGATVIPSGYDDPPEMELAVDGDRVSYRLPFPSITLKDDFRAGPTGIGEEHPIHREEYGAFVTPAIHVGGSDVVDKNGVEERRFQTKFVHFFTPETATSCHYVWIAARNWAVDDEGITQAIAESLEEPFHQDAVALSAIQRICLDQPDYPEISVRADRAALIVRRVLQDILRRDGASQVVP